MKNIFHTAQNVIALATRWPDVSNMMENKQNPKNCLLLWMFKGQRVEFKIKNICIKI